MILSRAEASKRSDYVTPTMKRISLRFRLELSEYHLCDSFFFCNFDILSHKYMSLLIVLS
jgi:hypothetical protein